MEVAVLSTITGACAGVLRMTPTETAIYDPVTGRKKYLVAGMDYSENFVLPIMSSSQRLAQVLEVGAVVYDSDDGYIYIGDGETAGGQRMNKDLADEMESNAAQFIQLDQFRNNVLQRFYVLENRTTAIEQAMAVDVATVIPQQLVFYTVEGPQYLGTIDCGDWQTDSFFPMDYVFGDWGTFGIQLHFGDELPKRGTPVPVSDRLTHALADMASTESGMMAVIGGA